MVSEVHKPQVAQMERGLVSPDLDDRIIKAIQSLFKARPYTKAIPFSVATGASPLDVLDLWVVKSATFVINRILIRSSVAGIDLDICDSNKNNVFARSMPPIGSYEQINLGEGYRSLDLQGKVVLSNPAGTVATIRGVLYGYEVTRDNWHR